MAVKYGKEALREARAAREAGRAPNGWTARAVDWATRKLEERRDDDEEGDGGRARSAFEGSTDEGWRETEDWDSGASEDADASGDAATKDADAGSVTRDEDETESDGAGVGMRVMYPETFDEVTAAARNEAGACASDGSSDDVERWLVVACARSSPTCRDLAPRLALMSHDSAFTSSEGAGYGVGWVDCTPENARGWCVNRLGAKAVPTIVAIARGREETYDGGFKGDFMREIRRFATSHAASASTSCSASRKE